MSQSAIHESGRVYRPVAARRPPLSTLSRMLENWLNRRHLRQDLSSLDDRLLEDVGISREDALWKAGEPFWRD
jgi:uncharacterized protein YjiS (DUF1127 family)